MFPDHILTLPFSFHVLFPPSLTGTSFNKSEVSATILQTQLPGSLTQDIDILVLHPQIRFFPSPVTEAVSY